VQEKAEKAAAATPTDGVLVAMEVRIACMCHPQLAARPWFRGGAYLLCASDAASSILRSSGGWEVSGSPAKNSPYGAPSTPTNPSTATPYRAAAPRARNFAFGTPTGRISATPPD
jgi:hypothetical protein